MRLGPRGFWLGSFRAPRSYHGVRRFWSYIRVIELIDSPVLFMADSTVYIAKNLPLRKLVMSVNGHYIIRFWFLLASTARFQYLRWNC